jgi:hypothetical protein
MQTAQQEQLQYYRHKAAECARKALACREPSVRRGFAEAARRWRVLAQKSEDGPKAEPVSIFALRR